ncbi:MAG: tRNA 2-thiouridine(34) synthase MnmA [Candidatus Babeliales bacterium]
MKIAVLVSGGVDSSVALQLLKQQGHDLTAFYLKIWLEDELSFLGNCPWEDDLHYVQLLCKQLQVPLKIISLQKEYCEEIVSYALAEVKAGRTPNPDIFCNQRIKFGLFLDKISSSFEKVATGHYAQLSYHDNKIQLLCAPDLVKDQTYFLSYLSQDQLKRSLFPIGHLQKSEVRSLAHQFDLPTKNRKDSQGICFLGRLKFREFVKYHLGEKEGLFLEIETDKEVGKHAGYWFYTIGQRQGIGLANGPWYVVSKDIEKNIVYISRNYYAIDKERDSFLITQCNWFNGLPIKKELQVKIRHGELRHTCTIKTDKSGGFNVKLALRDQGIAAGQFAVFYDGDICLGGGIIG